MELNSKLAYETPELEALGSIEAVTMGNSDGAATDADFATGTLKGDITFS